MGWQLIQSNTVHATVSSVTFSNIPQTYKSLKILGSSRGDTSATNVNFAVSFNGAPSGTSYTSRLIYGTGSAASSANATSQPNFWYSYSTAATAANNVFSSVEYTIPNYSSSNNKIILSESAAENNTTGSVALGIASGIWQSSSAVTSVVIGVEYGNITFGSTFTLYGLI